MADKLKDTEDQLLESLFANEALADDGFSKLVVRRIRRQIWIRRLALPVAMLVGGTIAIKPLTQLAGIGSQLTETAVKLAPASSLEIPAALTAQLPLAMTLVGCLAIGMFVFRLSEE
ncbi:MAG: hypothetical protein AAF351_02865 [Pseudomonadota bacterium]